MPPTTKNFPALVWNLRMVCARRGIWRGADLRRLLRDEAGYDLSAASVSSLLTKDPAMVRWDTLEALCHVLHCAPGELFVTEEEYAAQSAPNIAEVEASAVPVPAVEDLMAALEASLAAAKAGASR